MMILPKSYFLLFSGIVFALCGIMLSLMMLVIFLVTMLHNSTYITLFSFESIIFGLLLLLVFALGLLLTSLPLRHGIILIRSAWSGEYFIKSRLIILLEVFISILVIIVILIMIIPIIPMYPIDHRC